MMAWRGQQKQVAAGVRYPRTMAMMIAATLSGCGLPNMIGDTTQAVLQPVGGVAQTAMSGLRTVDHSVTTVAQASTTNVSEAAGALRNSSANLSDAAKAAQAASATKAAYSPPQLTAAQKEAVKKAKDAPQPDLPMLPDETLAKLSEDQKGLQNAAQKQALTAPVGETIFWDFDNRSGTVVAKDEHKMGETVCRSFEQSVTIDGVVEKGKGIACRDDETGRWSLAF